MKLDILAFGAHPDDVELYAGGTLAKMSGLGYATGVVDMSRGEMGSRGTSAIRAREAQEAGRILGLKVRENLGLRDGSIPVAPEARLQVIRMIRKYRPMLVLVHYWEDKHPDHVNTSRLVGEAVHHAGLAKIKTGQERFRPNAVLYFKLSAQTFPTLVVDVSDYAAQRLAAIQAYRSQLFDPSRSEPSTYLSQPDFLARVDAIHSYYGALIGRAKGEGFHMKGTIEVPDLIEFAKNQNSNRRN